jgi:hypothetical protein
VPAARRFRRHTACSWQVGRSAIIAAGKTSSWAGSPRGEQPDDYFKARIEP